MEQIPSEPTDFAINSALQASFFPNWGATCTLSVFENSLDNFKVYPNPVQDQLFLTWADIVTQNKIEVGIYDINGKSVINKSYNQKPTEINVSQLSSGVYFLKVISGEQSQVKRIIKK